MTIAEAIIWCERKLKQNSTATTQTLHCFEMAETTDSRTLLDTIVTVVTASALVLGVSGGVVIVQSSDNRSSCLFRHQKLFSAPQHSVGLRIKRLTSLTSLTPRHVLQVDRGRQDLPPPSVNYEGRPVHLSLDLLAFPLPHTFRFYFPTVLQTTCRRQWPVTSCASTAGTPSLSTPSPATSPFTKSVRGGWLLLRTNTERLGLETVVFRITYHGKSVL